MTEEEKMLLRVMHISWLTRYEELVKSLRRLDANKYREEIAEIQARITVLKKAIGET